MRSRVEVPASLPKAKDTSSHLPRGKYIKAKLGQEFDSKLLIAQYVAEHYVHDFDAVLLDAGSTAEKIAEALFATKSYLSVLTNNMGAYAAYTLALDRARADGRIPREHLSPMPYRANENELLLAGGRYDATYEALFGNRTIEAFKQFKPNITIIGVSGLRCGGAEGVFCHGADEEEMKRLLWNKATDIRLIATDWTKIGKRDAHAFGVVEQLGMNARKGVVVTSAIPRDAHANDRKEFDDQIDSMQRSRIQVDIVKT